MKNRDPCENRHYRLRQHQCRLPEDNEILPGTGVRGGGGPGLGARPQESDEYGIAKAVSVEALLADPAIEIIVNLTTPQAHASVAMAALEAGKSVYNEKPLTVTVAEGRRLVETAEARGLRLGCAPGTFLGGGLQTCRKIIDDGTLGTPVAATAFMMGRGHEHWHPDPEFYYKVGGGPMMDMGPYYLTALRNLLGPIRKVNGMAAITIPERTIGSEARRGQKIQVETPDHVAGNLEFAGGAIGTIITSFAVMHAEYPPIRVFGTEGTLSVPDPNSLRVLSSCGSARRRSGRRCR